jgi:hypothetical protein
MDESNHDGGVPIDGGPSGAAKPDKRYGRSRRRQRAAESRPVDIIAAADLIRRDRAADVAEVDLGDGRRAFVRVMTLAELEVFQGEWDGEAKRDTISRIILATCCDRGGNLLFGPDQLEDVRQIRARDALVLSRTSLEINRLTEEAVEPIKKDLPKTIENS